MKIKLIALVFFSMYFTYVNAQDFKNTSQYSLSTIKHVEYSSNGPYVEKVPMYLLNAYESKLFTFMVSNEHGISGSEVVIADASMLTNGKNMIKVTLPECSCGCTIDTYYFIVDTSDKLIPLPQINWDEYEAPVAQWLEYKIASDSTIELIEFNHDAAVLSKAYKNGTHKKLVPKQKVIKRYSWDGELVKQI